MIDISSFHEKICSCEHYRRGIFHFQRYINIWQIPYRKSWFWDISNSVTIQYLFSISKITRRFIYFPWLNLSWMSLGFMFTNIADYEKVSHLPIYSDFIPKWAKEWITVSLSNNWFILHRLNFEIIWTWGNPHTLLQWKIRIKERSNENEKTGQIRNLFRSVT
jgi:hypothetical protein